MRDDEKAWQVIIVEPCLSWLHKLRGSDRRTLIQISQAITVLAEEGPGLGRPLVDTITGSQLPNLKNFGLDQPEAARSGCCSSSIRSAGQCSSSAGTSPESREEAMSQPPLNNPGSRHWDDLVEEFDFSPNEKREIREGANHMIAEVRARRLAEVRKRQNATQVEVAAAMGVSQARVSRIEKGQLEKSEVETLAAYVKALGGKLKIIADFGDESYVLG